MEVIEQVYAAFADAPRPTAANIATGSLGDLERERVTELLAPYVAREVPDNVFEHYEIVAMLPVLSETAFRYFMPRCIDHALSHPESQMVESLMYALSMGRKYDERVLAFATKEREVIARFLEIIATAPPAWLYQDHLKAAREEWNAVV